MGWWRAAGAAVIAAALRAGQADAQAVDGTCELARVDRARTSSRACVVCHDGSAGVGITIRPAGSGHGDHPVDVDYAAAAARDPKRYVPASRLRRDVPLVGGKVTCTSCHDGASPHRKRAVDPVNLCQACHDM